MLGFFVPTLLGTRGNTGNKGGMTKLEDNVKTILERSGYKIPPYRLTCMTKTVAKIMAVINDNGPISYTAYEAQMIMDMVSFVISKGADA